MSIERDHRIVAQSRCPLLLHRLKSVPNTVSVFQCFSVAMLQRFTVAMFQPVLADLPVADRQPIGARGCVKIGAASLFCNILKNIKQSPDFHKPGLCHVKKFL